MEDKEFSSVEEILDFFENNYQEDASTETQESTETTATETATTETQENTKTTEQTQTINYGEILNNISELKNEEKEQNFKEMYEKIFGKTLKEDETEEKEIPNEITAENIVSVFDNDEKYSVKKNYKFIGIAFKTYIIIEMDNEMYIIDQHAAHERIM